MPRNVEAVCLLVGDEEIPVHFARAVETMVRQTPVSVPLVVIAERPTPRNGDGSGDGSDEASGGGPLGRALSAVENSPPVRWTRRALAGPGEHVPLGSVAGIGDAEVVRCTVDPAEGAAVSVPDRVVDRIADAADVAIHEGVGIVSGRVLTAPAHGVLGFHHGDLREYRGIGYGFWEFLHGAPESGVTLQRLREELDAGEVIAFRRVAIGDAHNYGEVRERLGLATEPMLATGIWRLRDPEFVPETVPADELGPVYASYDVTTGVKARFLCKEALGRFVAALGRLAAALGAVR